jgi:hypothetical protein
MRHIYAKLGTHRRADTVARARDLGMLAPSPLKGRSSLVTEGVSRDVAVQEKARAERL